jgi:hypothetical protein
VRLAVVGSFAFASDDRAIRRKAAETKAPTEAGACCLR